MSNGYMAQKNLRSIVFKQRWVLYATHKVIGFATVIINTAIINNSHHKRRIFTYTTHTLIKI